MSFFTDADFFQGQAKMQEMSMLPVQLQDGQKETNISRKKRLALK